MQFGSRERFWLHLTSKYACISHLVSYQAQKRVHRQRRELVPRALVQVHPRGPPFAHSCACSSPKSCCGACVQYHRGCFSQRLRFTRETSAVQASQTPAVPPWLRCSQPRRYSPDWLAFTEGPCVSDWMRCGPCAAPPCSRVCLPTALMGYALLQAAGGTVCSCTTYKCVIKVKPCPF